ncbi:MAG: hypothetical protein JWO23_1993, partial [Solirubrobacterales bacterium]|nr:hypothetical protein [Solirubrobacterales bacterium]
AIRLLADDATAARAFGDRVAAEPSA